MSRYERRLFFERLIAMRAAYRAEVQQVLEMTLQDAMAYAERALAAEVPAEVATMSGSKPSDAELDA